LNLSFNSNYSLLKKINALPFKRKWINTPIQVTGNIKGKDGTYLTENLELWHRDIIEAIEELIANPSLREHMKYAPIKMYEDQERTRRVYEGMETCDWWWEMQVSRQFRS
jgi:hypothetical protein